jgi:sugar phosphate permease
MLIVLLVRGSEGQGDGGGGRQAPAGPETSFPGSSRGGGTLGALWQVLANRDIWPLSIAMLFFNGGYFSLITWTPVFVVRQLGGTQSEAGSVTSLITAAHIVSWPLLGLLTDRLGRRKLVVQMSLASGCLVSLGFALVVPGFPLWGAGAIALAAGFVMGGMILPTVMAVEIFPRELAGTVASVVNTFFFIGALTIPVLLGRLVDLTGSLPLAFVAAGAVQALALVPAAFIREPGRGR